MIYNTTFDDFPIKQKSSLDLRSYDATGAVVATTRDLTKIIAQVND